MLKGRLTLRECKDGKPVKDKTYISSSYSNYVFLKKDLFREKGQGKWKPGAFDHWLDCSITLSDFL